MLENRTGRGRIRCEQEAFDRESTSEFAFLTNPTLGRKDYTDRVRQCICMNGMVERGFSRILSVCISLMASVGGPPYYQQRPSFRQ